VKRELQEIPAAGQQQFAIKFVLGRQQAFYLHPFKNLFWDSTIQRINHFPADKYYGNQLCYPLDRDLSSK